MVGSEDKGIEVFKDIEVSIYLITQFQEFVRVEEAKKIAGIKQEASILPVNVATAFMISSSLVNSRPIETVGANVGRDNLKTVKPSKKAQALQEQIDNIGNSEPDFYQNKILARDEAYLKYKKLEAERLEKERLEVERLEKDRLIKEINEEEARVRILRNKLATLQGENLKDESLSDQNPNTAPQSSTQERNLEPKTQIDFDKVYKRLFEVFEDDLIEISGEFIMFVQFVVDSLNQNLGSEFENTKFENWQNRNGILNISCFPNIIRILQEKYSFDIFKSEIELKINLSCNKLLFN